MGANRTAPARGRAPQRRPGRKRRDDRACLNGILGWDDELRAINQAQALGFYARLFVQAGMPHSDPATTQYERSNGSLTLTMMAPAKVGLPYGSLPRLLLAWLTTEAVRTKEPHLVLGNTLRAFLDQLGLSSTGGKRGDITRLRNQMRRLFSSSEGQTLPSVSRQRPKGGPQRNVGVERVTFNQYRTPYVILVVLCALLATVIPFTLFGESSTLERLVWGGLEVLTLSFVPAFAKFAQFPVSLDVGARGIELVHRRGGYGYLGAQSNGPKSSDTKASRS